MDTAAIVQELEAERDRLESAIAALTGGRAHIQRAQPIGGGKRHLSVAARKKIGEAMRKRWAERKKQMG
jgi:exonuclease VII small subunit